MTEAQFFVKKKNTCDTNESDNQLKNLNKCDAVNSQTQTNKSRKINEAPQTSIFLNFLDTFFFQKSSCLTDLVSARSRHHDNAQP